MKATFLVVLVTFTLIALLTLINPELGTLIALSLMQPIVLGIKTGLFIRNLFS